MCLFHLRKSSGLGIADTGFQTSEKRTEVSMMLAFVVT